MPQLDFDINVLRTSVGKATISVKAESRAAAQQSALEIAGQYLYREVDADYELDGNSPWNVDEFSDLPIKPMYLGMRTDNDFARFPPGIQITVTPNFLRHVSKLMTLCTAHKLDQIKADHTHEFAWLGGGGAYFNPPTLCVSEGEFSFESHPNGYSYQIETESVKFAELLLSMRTESPNLFPDSHADYLAELLQESPEQEPSTTPANHA